MSLNFIPVQSSNIDAIAHDGATTLTVRFKHGGAYAYDGAGPEIFVRLLNAESVGKALNELVKKPGLPFRKVEVTDGAGVV